MNPLTWLTTPLQKIAAILALVLALLGTWQAYGAWERHRGAEQARIEQERRDTDAIKDADQAERDLRARGDDDPDRRLRDGSF